MSVYRTSQGAGDESELAEMRSDERNAEIEEQRDYSVISKPIHNHSHEWAHLPQFPSPFRDIDIILGYFTATFVLEMATSVPIGYHHRSLVVITDLNKITVNIFSVF